jgi:hypothetical protein
VPFAILIALVIVAGATWLVIRAATPTANPASGPECVIQPVIAAVSTTALADSTSGVAGNAAVSLTAVQIQHASTINAVGLAKEVPDRARTIALATALQESGLRNLTTGDLDSVGLFQQRTSQGWGTVDQILDPVYSAEIFYDRLLKVSRWESRTLTDAAQAVQFSAFPDAYAKWEPAAEALRAALSGDPARVGCRTGAQPPTTPAPTRPALAGTGNATAELSALLAAAQAELGGLTVEVVDAGGASALVVAAVGALAADDSARALAAWSVAHAAGSGVTAIVVGEQRWADHRWQTAPEPVGTGRVRLSVG